MTPLGCYPITLRPPSSTLFPYTTLFRSLLGDGAALRGLDRSQVLIEQEDLGVVRREKQGCGQRRRGLDRKSTRLNSSHQIISYAVFCLKKKKGKDRLV